MYSCIQAKDRVQNITHFLVHHANARDVCSSLGKIHAFGTSCLRQFSLFCLFFSYFKAEKESEQQKSILQSRTISAQIFQQLPALGSKSFASESSEAPETCILQFYYMARACKYITRTVIGQYSGPDFPVMPGIMSDVNALLVKWKYRKCKSTFDSTRWNDLKLNEKTQFL